MNVLAVIFFVISIICTIIAIIGALLDEDDWPTVLFFSAFIPTVIIWLLNLYIFPGKEARYVPQTQIAASVNRTDAVDRTNLRVGEPFYLQIRIKVDSNSFTRRFFRDNKIPFRVEISSPELASFTVERSEGFEEYREPEFDNNRATYFFNVLAEKPTKENADKFAILNFRGEAKTQGVQQIRIIYDGKVSGTYSRVDSFEYRMR